MTIYLGDFPDLHTTVVVFFNAFDSNDPSASVIVSAFVVGDVAVYKNGSVTQRTSTNGYTLLDTDGINFDGLVGVHGVSIDLSDDTDTDFFVPGAEYDVIIGPITIDAAAVTFHAAHFSIERAGGVLALLKGGTDGLAAHTTLLNDVPTVAEFNARTLLSASYATAAALATVDTVVDAIKVITDQFVFTVANLVDANTKAISDDTGAADALEALMDGVLEITVNDAAATTTAFAADGFTEATDDIFNGRLTTFLTGAGQYEQTDITDYDASGGTQGEQEFTVTALVAAPANNVIAIVH